MLQLYELIFQHLQQIFEIVLPLVILVVHLHQIVFMLRLKDFRRPIDVIMLILRKILKT